MHPDHLETELENQPLRQLPAEWRQDIINTAKAAAKRPTIAQDVSSLSWPLLFSQLRLRFVGLLWPAPRAWGALAVIWLGILVTNHGLSPRQELASQRESLPASLSAWREQERLLTELLESPGVRVPVANRPRPEPTRPRSEGWSDFVTA